MPANRTRALIGAAVAVIAAGALAASVAVASAGPGQPGRRDRAAGNAAGSRPPGRVTLGWFPVRGDQGTLSRALAWSGSIMVYLNVTPRQGDETLRDWAEFRVDHLREEDARSARPDGSASGLAFRGGTGPCVIDDYVTRVRANRVPGARRASGQCTRRGRTGRRLGPLRWAAGAGRKQLRRDLTALILHM